MSLLLPTTVTFMPIAHIQIVSLVSLSAGGVIVSGYHDRIKVDNTLDERLRLLEELVRRNALPCQDAESRVTY